MKINVVSIFRNEAKFLKEWIEFHRIVGVNKFYLVNHLSNDNYLEVLKEYIDHGIVELFNINIETIDGSHERKNIVNLVNQIYPMFDEIIKNSDSDWTIHISTDEFLYVKGSNNISQILSNMDKNIGQIYVNWRIFGNSKYELKDNELIIEKLVKCSKLEDKDNLHVKFIVRNLAYHSISSVHFCGIKDGFFNADSRGNINNISSNRYETLNHIDSPIYINHYKFRDLKWTETKLNWYRSWGRSNVDEIRNMYNEEENFDIHIYLDELKRNLCHLP